MMDLIVVAFWLALLLFGGWTAVGFVLLAIVLALIVWAALRGVLDWVMQWFRT